MLNRLIARSCAVLLATVCTLALAKDPWASWTPFEYLLDQQGVSGHEEAVANAVAGELPKCAKPTVDNVGNLKLVIGDGPVSTVLVAPLDEYGYIVSRITDDGYLRLHRHVAATGDAMRDQFTVGQPVEIRAAGSSPFCRPPSLGTTVTGCLPVPGVTVTPSVHLSRLAPAGEVARMKGIDDLWVDVGASNAAEVAKRGIRLLDPVNVRERAQPLANGRIAGPSAQMRAGAFALVELVRAIDPSTVRDGIAVVWVAQSLFNERGLARIAASIGKPKVVHLVGAQSTTPSPLPAAWSGAAVERWSVPVLYPETPVEVVDTGAIDDLARRLASRLGVAFGDPALETVKRVNVIPEASTIYRAPGTPDPFATENLFKTLLEAYGVSGHENLIREIVLQNLPGWARPTVDAKGNVVVTAGPGEDEPKILFVAHMDEIGFEIASIRPDGTAAIRERGGMFLSLYEGHPVWVDVPGKRIPAILAPRPRYASATTSQPELANLTLYFGTDSAAQTAALGVAAGQPVAIRKSMLNLIGTRRAGRAVDDRAGVTALIRAMHAVDPAKLDRKVVFAFSVEEETGLSGARALAAQFHPTYAVAIDTFVSTDTPVDLPYLAHAPLGAGAVVRGVDNSMVTPSATIDRIFKLADEKKIPLQLGVTQGGIDSSTFSAGGATDIGISWPGRHSHSPVEVIDLRDLDALTKLIATMAQDL